MKTVRESIKDYGFIQPVVVNSHECAECGDRRGIIIIGGHRRLDAARAEGMTEVEDARHGAAQGGKEHEDAQGGENASECYDILQTK